MGWDLLILVSARCLLALSIETECISLACVEERKQLTSVKMLPAVLCSLSFPSEAAYPFRKANVSLWFVLRTALEKAQAV